MIRPLGELPSATSGLDFDRCLTLIDAWIGCLKETAYLNGGMTMFVFVWLGCI